jgi:CheY-like chemotaxis protein
MRTALVIDDTRATADSLVRILKALNFEAKAAYGSAPGMLALREAVPDVVFLDINMPGVSGFELLGFVVREPRLSKVPVIVVTSDDQPQTREQALHGGATDFLLKPVMVDALEAALKKARLL